MAPVPSLDTVPTGGAPLNIPVWPNAVTGSYPVCDNSKYVATLDLILKSYLRYLQLCSTETSARARSPDTGTTTSPGTTRGCLRTAHGFPSCALSDATDHATSTIPHQVSRAVRLHHVAKAKLHPFSKGTIRNT